MPPCTAIHSILMGTGRGDTLQLASNPVSALPLAHSTSQYRPPRCVRWRPVAAHCVISPGASTASIRVHRAQSDVTPAAAPPQRQPRNTSGRPGTHDCREVSGTTVTCANFCNLDGCMPFLTLTPILNFN